MGELWPVLVLLREIAWGCSLLSSMIDISCDAGIPKFYRWLSERYPLLNMPVTATEAPPEIDNLYLDMNGIIHNCTHANDPNLKLTETEMVLRIFNYLDKLIQIMKPKKLVFLAIDGGCCRQSMGSEHVCLQACYACICGSC